MRQISNDKLCEKRVSGNSHRYEYSDFFVPLSFQRFYRKLQFDLLICTELLTNKCRWLQAVTATEVITEGSRQSGGFQKTKKTHLFA